MSSKGSTVRNSSIELLRIIAMIMIIVSHFSIHSGFDLNSMPFGFNKILLQSTMLGNLGVDIFFLISGYFLSNNKFDMKKLLKLVFEVFSYSIIIYVIFCIMDSRNFNFFLLIKNCFPVMFSQYWFVTAYVIMYLFFPFFNKFINSLTKYEHILLIGLMLFIWSFLYLLLNVTYFNTCLITMMSLYFIGAYIRKYSKEILEKYKNIIKFCMYLSIVILLGITIFLQSLNFSIAYIGNFYLRNSLFIVLIAVGIFVTFLDKKVNSKLINKISSCMFGVYLLHDNNFMRKYIWIDIFKGSLYQNSSMLIFWMLISVFVVFIFCVILEFIRKNTIQKVVDSFIDKYYDKIKAKVKKI